MRRSEVAWIAGTGFETRRGHECSSLLFVVCVCVSACVRSGMCDELIPLSKESYRMRVSNCV